MRNPIRADSANDQPPIRRQSGRPSKLTTSTRRRLINAIRNGSHYEPACRAAGISFQTFRNWLSRGERERSGPFFEFFEDIKKAEADAELRALRLWNRAMPDDWRAAKDFLERRHPGRWNPRDSRPGPTLDLTFMLERIEERAYIARDPRKPIPGKPTIIDAMYARIPTPRELPPETRTTGPGLNVE